MVTEITRTVDGPAQFCRGALERGQEAHLAKTYTTLHYRYAIGSTQEREGRFHFCDAHPPQG